MHYIIEGIDRLGKGTLIENIQKVNGPYMKVHYERPLISKEVENNYFKNSTLVDDAHNNCLLAWQKRSFLAGFRHLATSDISTIYDRFHLGETVYGPLYRDYCGDYVFGMESILQVHQADVRLILLVTSDFSFIEDDGDSFNFSAKAKEQDMFISAFHKSTIENKIIIDVNNFGKFQDPDAICDLAMNHTVKTLDRRSEPRD